MAPLLLLTVAVLSIQPAMSREFFLKLNVIEGVVSIKADSSAPVSVSALYTSRSPLGRPCWESLLKHKTEFECHTLFSQAAPHHSCVRCQLLTQTK